MTKPDESMRPEPAADEYTSRRKERLERLAELSKLAGSQTMLSPTANGAAAVESIPHATNAGLRPDKKTLEEALADLEASKAQTAEFRAKHAPEFEAEIARVNAMQARLDSLPQHERRQVLDAADKKHISAAPAPLEPIRSRLSPPPPARLAQGDAPLSGMFSEKHRPTPIDWSHWRHAKVKLWEACALSLNINPDNMKHHPQGWMAGPGSGPIFTAASFPSKAVNSDFDKRLRLLNDNYTNSKYFTDVNNLHAGRNHATVTLRNFALWGLSVEFQNMPPELVAMAATESMTAPAQTPEAPLPVVTARASDMRYSETKEPPLDLISFDEALGILRTPVDATASELAMWICMHELPAWHKTLRQFHCEDLNKPDTADDAIERLKTLNLLLSRSMVEEWNPDLDERWLDYDEAEELVEKAARDATHKASKLKNWQYTHDAISDHDRSQWHCDLPQIAVHIPGNGWATRIKDGLVLKNQIDIFLKRGGITEIAPAQNTATPAPVVQPAETKEQRQDRRLQACIDDGLPMNEKAALLRLPDGVGNVAGREGVTRQTFSTDVKAALKRRESAIREGATVRRA